jgi:hypothetical protein
MAEQVSVERAVQASADAVWALVSDVTNMGRWSPETTSCRWVGGASGPAVGARFRGANRNGWHRWSTTNRVVSCEPGRSFAFETTFGPIAIARWSYAIEPTDDGCVVTESWEDLRNGLARATGGISSGVSDRATHNRETMTETLDRLASAAQQA